MLTCDNATVTTSCSIVDCGRPSFSRGWCRTHYRRDREGKPMDAPIRVMAPGSVCTVDGCDRPVHSHGWCGMHRQRIGRHGDPAAWKRRGEGHGMWSGDRAGYHGAHKRVYALRGAASGRNCVDCSELAAEWSYDLKDPDERVSDVGTYSLDPDHYEPRCVSCHKLYDLRGKKR